MIPTSWLPGLLCLLPAAQAILPAHSWDSHIHVIDPERFPMADDRPYTPKPATFANATAFQKKIGMSHFLIVLPSVYGTNNNVLLDALEKFNGSARGIAVVDPAHVDDSTLDKLNATGVVGLRVNQGLNETADAVIQRVKENAAIAAQWDWVLELWIDLEIWVELHDIILGLGIKVVVDHFAHALTTSKTKDPATSVDPYTLRGFREVIHLVTNNYLFVKISAPYQNSNLYPYYQDLEAAAAAIISNGPDQVVWGSDWPHTASAAGNGPGGPLVPQDYRNVDEFAMVLQAMQYAGSDRQIQKMFVDNPRRLWGWYDATS